jgi:hypothetical protein
MDEDVLVEGLRFRGRLLQQLRVLGQAVRLAEEHAAGDAPVQGVGLVLPEIHAGRAMQQVHDLVEVRLVLLRRGP